MSIHAVAEDRPVTSDEQVIAELATGALESIARIHAAGLAEVVDIAENPVAVRHEPPAETPAPVEVQTEVEVEEQAQEQVTAAAEEPAVDEEPVTDQFAVPAETDVVQPVEVLRAVPVSTRGRHVSEAETTEFAASRAA